MASKTQKAEAKPAAGLSARQARFVAEYLVDQNSAAAARRAGYSAKTAEQQGSRLLRNAQVAKAVATARGCVAERLGLDAARVLQEAWNILVADPRELIEYRVGSCRHCWGIGNRFQRTAGELERDRDAWERQAPKTGAALASGFDDKGGAGFDPRRPPNPDCPECFGDGQGRAIVKDTRSISPAAASLYAGVKQTRDGVEVRMLSKIDALERLARHLGLYDRHKVRGHAGELLAADSGASLADRGRAVLAAASAGDLPMGHAAQLLAGVASLAKLIETDELEARLAALEGIAHANR